MRTVPFSLETEQLSNSCKHLPQIGSTNLTSGNMPKKGQILWFKSRDTLLSDTDLHLDNYKDDKKCRSSTTCMGTVSDKRRVRHNSAPEGSQFIAEQALTDSRNTLDKVSLSQPLSYSNSLLQNPSDDLFFLKNQSLRRSRRLESSLDDSVFIEGKSNATLPGTTSTSSKCRPLDHMEAEYLEALAGDFAFREREKPRSSRQRGSLKNDLSYRKETEDLKNFLDDSVLLEDERWRSTLSGSSKSDPFHLNSAGDFQISSCDSVFAENERLRTSRYRTSTGTLTLNRTKSEELTVSSEDLGSKLDYGRMPSSQMKAQKTEMPAFLLSPAKEKQRALHRSEPSLASTAQIPIPRLTIRNITSLSDFIESRGRRYRSSNIDRSAEVLDMFSSESEKPPSRNETVNTISKENDRNLKQFRRTVLSYPIDDNLLNPYWKPRGAAFGKSQSEREHSSSRLLRRTRSDPATCKRDCTKRE